MAKIKLRDYQQDAFNTFIQKLEEGDGQVKGRFVYPTGAGKTFMQAAMLGYRLGNTENNIHVVLAPRIVLLNQLIAEYRRGIQGIYDKPFRAIAFHSGDLGEPHEDLLEEFEIDWVETSTTSLDTVIEELEHARMDGIDLVVFSTYHSMAKLAFIDFDTLLADESQFLVAENFNDALREMKSPVQLFFTATERHTASDSGRGLNNEQLFGTRLGQVSPATLIEQGHIVPPKVHVMNAIATNPENAVIDTVNQVALAQHTLAQTIGKSKILFAMKGTDDVKTVEDRMGLVQEQFPTHTIYTITSKNGSKIDGNSVERDDFLKSLKECNNALIFHYDILSEGIDVDGITGVVLMRAMSQAKLLQTIGRAVRPYKADPSKKPYAWITVPVVNGSEDDKQRVLDFCYAMINDTGYDIDLTAEAYVETDNTNHEPDPDNVEDDYSEPQLNNGLGILDDVRHQIDLMQTEAFYQRMTTDDKLNFDIFELGVA